MRTTSVETYVCMTDSSLARPSCDEYLLTIAVDVAARCNCQKRAVGAVITRDSRIISTGYNGTIAKHRNCIDGGCPRCADGRIQSGTELDRCIRLHAEQNALLVAARFGLAVEDSECWVTHEPCLDCTKSLIQAHIEEVTYWQCYPLDADREELRCEMRELGGTNFEK
jgi:dCMP deaminase